MTEKVMRVREHFRSMHAYVIAWLILPLAVILALMMVASAITYTKSIQSLAFERHQQLANLAAVSVSQEIEGYARVLETLGSLPELQDPSAEVRLQAIQQSAEALEGFTAGVLLTDPTGQAITAMPGSPLETLNQLTGLPVFQQSLETVAPAFSDVITTGGKNLILVVVPVAGPQGIVYGYLAGGLDLASSQLSLPIERLTSSTGRIAFLVDSRGISISHPDPVEIGKDFSERPYFGNAAAGNYGGKIWISPEGQRFVGAEALVTPAGWSLIIKESWEVIFAPAQWHNIIFLSIGLSGLVFISALAWVGTRRVVVPIQKLASHARLLAEGQTVPALPGSNIQELSQLKESFDDMVRQISSYRTGLRRYVGAITQSQEEERLRIARELHDETIQDLLAVYRRMELYIATEPDPAKQEQLSKLHKMIGQTAEGVRMISQDLRPMVLDDLGFVPAVRMLVRSAHQGKGAIPHASVDVHGEVTPLSPDQDLALYRIVQEALSNVRKHAEATGVEVKLEYTPQEVRLMIHDDGKGFTIPPSFTELVQTGSLGLMGIQERVWSVGGALQMQSQPGQGTRITVTIPCEKART